jgi:hypothetical protein
MRSVAAAALTGPGNKVKPSSDGDEPYGAGASRGT